MKMKKKKLTVALIILAVILVFPVYTGTLKDGGTKTFSALTYKIVCWNRLTDNGTYSAKRVYVFPYNFKSTGSLWYQENKKLSSSDSKEAATHTFEDYSANETVITQPATEQATEIHAEQGHEIVSYAKPFEEPSNYAAVSDPTRPKRDTTQIRVDTTDDLQQKGTVSTFAAEMLYGTVTKISGSILQASVGENGSLYDFTVSEKTELKIDGKDAKLSDFKQGDNVKILFHYPVAETYPAQVFDVQSITTVK